MEEGNGEEVSLDAGPIFLMANKGIWCQTGSKVSDYAANSIFMLYTVGVISEDLEQSGLGASENSCNDNSLSRTTWMSSGVGC